MSEPRLPWKLMLSVFDACPVLLHFESHLTAYRK